MAKQIDFIADLKLTASCKNETNTFTYSSTGSSMNSNNSINNCLNKMITPETFSIDSNKIIKSFENDKCTCCSKCDLIQNYQLLVDEIPSSLQNLNYAIYPYDQINYNASRLCYNKLINFFPHAIFYPTQECDISYLIKNFVKYNLTFTIRCGGHAYEPASTTSGYILDVKKLPKYVKVSKDRKTAIVNCGMNLGCLIEKLSSHSLITPTGSNPCVGTAGLYLAGGKGSLVRLYGLSCDNIISLTMINDQGKLIKANAHENPDLLWACKGAGCLNFGVIVNIEINVYEDVYCIFETLEWDWNAEQAIELFILYQQFILNLPNTISADFNMTYSNGSAIIEIKFVKFFDSNSNTNFNETNLFKKMYNPTVTTCKGYYSKITNCWLDSTKGVNPPFSKIKSSMIFKPVKRVGLELLVNSIETYVKKSYSNFNYQVNFSQLGGTFKDGDSSFFAKDAIAVISYYMEWTYPELTYESKVFLKNIYDSVLPYTSIYCFPNLIDYDIPDYMEQYYGSNQSRLISIKNKYDHSNIYKYFQSIPPSKIK